MAGLEETLSLQFVFSFQSIICRKCFRINPVGYQWLKITIIMGLHKWWVFSDFLTIHKLNGSMCRTSLLPTQKIDVFQNLITTAIQPENCRIFSIGKIVKEYVNFVPKYEKLPPFQYIFSQNHLKLSCRIYNMLAKINILTILVCVFCLDE